MEKGKITLTQKDAENTPAGGVVVGKRDGQTMIYDDASLGGYFVGKLHKDGGIKMINKSTGQPLEVQGSEVIITAPAVNDQTKREFEGKMMTNREILSKINSDGGGVSFADGGDIPAKIHTTDKEYEFGGKMVHDTDIAHSLGMNSTLKKGKQQFSSGDTTYDVDAIYNAIKKGKLRLKTKEIETFPMKYPVYDKNYAENNKIDFRKPNGITVRTESGEEVLIDGNHRMNNAYLKGKKTMKIYYIEDPKQISKFSKKNKFELGGENKVGGHLSKGKSLKQIAEMHNVTLTHINEELAKGLEVEKEHFSDFKERTRVAKDHLVENPNYYTILEKAGLKMGGHIQSKELVEKSKKGDTPARDLNNYNDVMDLEADGMVGGDNGLAFADGGSVNSKKDETYELKLDYRIGQTFEQDKLGGKYTCRILAMDFTVNESAEVNHNSYRIHYYDGESNSEQSSHYSFLKYLKKEPNQVKINVPYSIGSNIYYESSEYGKESLSLLKSNVVGFQVMYYGQRVGWFDYYLDSKESVDSKDAYSSVENYLNKVSSEITSTKLSSLKKLNQFVEPTSEKINVKVDYFIGQKFKLPVMGGFEDAEIIGIELGFDKDRTYPNSERSVIHYKEEDGRIRERELKYFIEETKQQKPNEIEVIVKAKVKDDVLILHRYMGGSKLQITQVQGYVLKLNDSGVNLEYCVSDDCYDEQAVYTSLENFKESITRSDKKKVKDVDNLSDLLEMVKSGDYANGGITPYDANVEGDSVDIIESEFAKGGVVYDTTKPKIEKITIKDTKFDRISVVGRNASTVSEFQQIVSDYIGNTPKENIDWISFYVNDNTRGSYYIDLNKGKKNTVKNVNPETLNSLNFRRVIDAKTYLVKNYDWTEFFELGSKKATSTPASNAIEPKIVDAVNVEFVYPNGRIEVSATINISNLKNALANFWNIVDKKSWEVRITPFENQFTPFEEKKLIIGSDFAEFNPETFSEEQLGNKLKSLYPDLDWSYFLKENKKQNVSSVTSVLPEYYEFIGDAKAFTKGKIYKIKNPSNLEDKGNFIDDEGFVNGYAEDNYKKFKPSTEEAFLVQEGITPKPNQDKGVMTVNVGYIYNGVRKDIIALNEKSLLKKLKELYNENRLFGVFITPNNSISDIGKQEQIFFAEQALIPNDIEVNNIDEYGLQDFLKKIYPNLEWELFFKLQPTQTIILNSVQSFDFTDTKIDVSNNPDLSQKVQKRAFELGWEWENGGGKTIDYNTFNYLYFTKTSISSGNTNSSFVNSPKREITEEEIFGNQAPASQAPASTSAQSFDFSDTKIWIGDNSELSRRVQEKAFENGIYWVNGSKSILEKDKPCLVFDEYGGKTAITFRYDRQEFDKLKLREITEADIFGNKQTLTVSVDLGSVQEINDLKEAVGVLEGIASQASQKYNTSKYEESLELLKEVKEEYALALSFTPESSFMYERIELMKKITEIQKEITRITELKNGGAFYILSKVIDRLERGENWKELGKGEIMVNEVPQQEIDSVIYTEKFKNWFGDWEQALITKDYDYVSKAISESGKPLVMYHGAKRIKFSYRQVSNGVVYLAENRSYAEWFSATDSPYQKQGDYLTQCFVNLKNPIDLTAFGVEEVDLRDIIQFIDALYPLAKIYDVLPPNVAMAIMNNQLIGRNFRAWYIIRQFPELNKHIRDNTTYDGFIYYENNPSDMIINESGDLVENITKATAVFNSNQVKLVDAILFDDSLDDWRFETGGKVN